MRGGVCSLELRDSRGCPLQFAGTLPTGRPADSEDVCEWLTGDRDRVTVTGDTVYYLFEVAAGDGNPSLLWGFAITATAATPVSDDRAARSAAFATLCERKVRCWGGGTVDVKCAPGRQPRFPGRGTCAPPPPPSPPHTHTHSLVCLLLCTRTHGIAHVHLPPPFSAQRCSHGQRDIEELVREAALWSAAHDAKLVEYMNDWADDTGRNADEMGALELRPSSQQLRFKFELLADVPLPQLHFRAAQIKWFNRWCAAWLIGGWMSRSACHMRGRDAAAACPCKRVVVASLGPLVFLAFWACLPAFMRCVFSTECFTPPVCLSCVPCSARCVREFVLCCIAIVSAWPSAWTCWTSRRWTSRRQTLLRRAYGPWATSSFPV
jgi:hypothetical protein